MRILLLIHEAVGGRGGIARFNADFLGALVLARPQARIVVAPRYGTHEAAALPESIRIVGQRPAGKLAFAARTLQALAALPNPDLIIAGHLHLLPYAALARMFTRAKLGTIVHGIDAWEPTGRPLVDRRTRDLDFFLAVSELTKARFAGWTGLDPARGLVLPNTVDLGAFGPGPKDPELESRWNLHGRKVLLTLARLEAAERYKGIDEIIDVLPALVERVPDLVYVIAGDGNDRDRLDAKVAERGLGTRVVFTGRVAEEDKVKLYRTADAFAMPGRGEGFGIVFLEAMACGIPVVGSKLDASREALDHGKLGVLVDPRNRLELIQGLVEALARPRGVVPPGLEMFALPAFRARVRAIVDQLVAR